MLRRITAHELDHLWELGRRLIRHDGTRERLATAMGSAVAKEIDELSDRLNVLATVGSVAPFVGLFGTVWGIYHALTAIGISGQASIDKVAGPVGESLIMTASGLAVAIPAVLAYNLFSKWLGQCEAELEGFAQDLLDLALRRAD